MLRHVIAAMVILIQWATFASATAQTDAIQRGLEATLMLFSTDGDHRFLGSAFAYEDAGLVLTNAHVVGTAPMVTVQSRDGHRQIGRVIARDVRRDIAILELRDARSGLHPSAEVLTIGAPVIALGAPLGLGYTATRGIVAADPRQVDLTVPLRLMQHDAAINPGNSGGPLIDENGALVGMNSQIADGSRYYIGISYAISAGDLARLVPQLLAGTAPDLPELGFDARPVTRDIATALAVAATGLLIDDVVTGGSADNAGLQAGDILLSLDGQELTDAGTLIFLVEAANGSPIAAKAWRRGTAVDLTLSLPKVDEIGLSRSAVISSRIITLADLAVTLDDNGRVALLPRTSPALRDGLNEGDLVLQVNGVVADPATLMETPLTETTVLLVQRDAGRTQHIVIYPRSNRQVLRPVGGNVLDMTVERF